MNLKEAKEGIKSFKTANDKNEQQFWYLKGFIEGYEQGSKIGYEQGRKHEWRKDLRGWRGSRA